MTQVPTRHVGMVAGRVTAAPYAGTAQVPLAPSPVYSKRKDSEPEVIGTYNAEFRAGFDRKITDWRSTLWPRRRRRASPSMSTCPTRRCTSRQLPTRPTQGRHRRGNWADLLVQMDDFTGKILDAL